ncbi:hypothetical protein EV1_013462 [Malus domestica]
MRAVKKETSRKVFQRLEGDFEPKNLSEVFKDHEALEEVEDKEAKIPKWVEVRPPQPSYEGGNVRMKGKMRNLVSPITKKDSAQLGWKWYVVGKDGRPIKEIRASMIRRVQRQHKAYMNSLKVPIALETSENVKFEKVPHEGRNQLHWRSKKEVDRANSKIEGEGDHVPQSPHPGKYRILRRTQEDMVMMPTLRWSPEPICFGTISLERRMPSPLLVDTLCEVPQQVHDFGITREEKLPELMLPKEAQAWLDEFMDHIGGKNEGLPEPSNFHVNMTYVLSAMFCAEPNQPATMKGDLGKTELGRTCLPELAKKEPEKVYSYKMVFSRPSLAQANHLKPIYVTARLEGIPFKRVLIDRGATINVIPLKQMKKLGRSEKDLIPTDLTVSRFFGAITRTHGILPLEVNLGSKQIMLAFFVVDNISTYGALLGRDWIYQSLSIPSTLH